MIHDSNRTQKGKLMKALEEIDEVKVLLEAQVAKDPAFNNHLKEVTDAMKTCFSDEDSVKTKLLRFMIEVDKFMADNSIGKDSLQLQTWLQLCDEESLSSRHMTWEMHPHLLWKAPPAKYLLAHFLPLHLRIMRRRSWTW